MHNKGSTFKPRTRSKPRAHFDAPLHTITNTKAINKFLKNDSGHRAKLRVSTGHTLLVHHLRNENKSK